MSPWHQLERELDAWAAAGRRATLWWRDDDAGRPGAALDRLLALLGDEVPLCLAVVPARADETLAARLAPTSVQVAVHGFDHRDRARRGGKKSEFPEDRDLDAGKAEIERGRIRLDEIFGARLLPLFVPPWNRLAAALVPALPELGFRGLSRFAPRHREFPVAGLVEINTHVDPVAWHGGGFLGQRPVLESLVGHLAARRGGRADADEPTGILSHHARHDEALWDFLANLKEALDGHRAAHWLSPVDAFSLGR